MLSLRCCKQLLGQRIVGPSIQQRNVTFKALGLNLTLEQTQSCNEPPLQFNFLTNTITNTECSQWHSTSCIKPGLPFNQNYRAESYFTKTASLRLKTQQVAKHVLHRPILHSASINQDQPQNYQKLGLTITLPFFLHCNIRFSGSYNKPVKVPLTLVHYGKHTTWFCLVLYQPFNHSLVLYFLHCTCRSTLTSE